MKYLFIILFVFANTTSFAYNSIQAADSLSLLLKSNPPSDRKIQIYRDLADIHSNLSKAKPYLLKMYDEARKANDRESMLGALHDILLEEINASDYMKDSIVKYIDHIKEIATPEEQKRLLPFYHMRIFDTLFSLNKGKEAIREEQNFWDLKSETEDDHYKTIASNYNIGSSFFMNGQIKNSLPYLEKAKRVIETLPEKYRFDYEKMTIRRLCYAYGQTGKNKESIELMEKFIQATEKNYKTNYQKKRPFYEIDLYLLQYYSYMICSLPFLTPEQETLYWERTQKIGKTLTNDFDKYNYYLCANNYYSNNRTRIDLPKAIAANDSLIKFAATLAPANLPGLYNINALLYERGKDYQNALKYLKISHHIKDSLASEINGKQLRELQVKHDINELNAENAKLELKNKQTMLISLYALLLVLVTVCTYLYFSLTKEKRMKAELKKLHQKAQESENMKQAFINSICHEIRTPLNAIVGFSDLIMNEEIDKEMRQEFPAEIQKNTAILTSLVNSMLEVANLDVSKEKLPCASTSLEDICVQEMGRLRSTPKKNIHYELDIPEGNSMIFTHEQYLSLVIEHLLNNANKFTEEGKIVLGYRFNKAESRVLISISDTGCGIPAEKREEVFQRFSKLNSFIAGNGLGLYLCQLIVNRLEGEIKIDTEYDQGTRMLVSLPI